MRVRPSGSVPQTRSPRRSRWYSRTSRASVVRFGRWNTEYFPDCGCDACGGSSEEEIEQLTEMVDVRDRRRVSRGGAAPLGAVHWEAWALLALIAFSEYGATPLGAVHWDWLAGWEWLAGTWSSGRPSPCAPAVPASTAPARAGCPADGAVWSWTGSRGPVERRERANADGR